MSGTPSRLQTKRLELNEFTKFSLWLIINLLIFTVIEKESDVVFYLLSLPLLNFQTPHIVNSCLNRLLELINNSSGANKLKKIKTMKEVWIPGLN